MLHIRPERPEDATAIRGIHQQAFGGSVESQLVDALRDGGFGPVSLVAEDGGRCVGHLLFSDLRIMNDGSQHPLRAVALAPLAVLPEFQNRGIGSALVRAGLEACRNLGIEAVFVLGEPAYYARFGFSAAVARGFESPYAGEAFQGIELRPGALAGVTGRTEYAAPFALL